MNEENSGNLFEDVKTMVEFVKRDEEKCSKLLEERNKTIDELREALKVSQHEVAELKKTLEFAIKQRNIKDKIIASLKRWCAHYKGEMKALEWLYCHEKEQNEKKKSMKKKPQLVAIQEELPIIMAANKSK